MARVLFVTSRVPYPPLEGHQLRSWNLLRGASEGHAVDLLSLRRGEDATDPDPELRRHVGRLECVPLPPLRSPATLARLARAALSPSAALLSARYVAPALRQQFRAMLAGVDLVHLDILALAALLDEVPPALPVVLNEHNVESELLQARAGIEPGHWRRRLLRWQAGRLRRFEAASCERATRVLACSSADAQRLQALAPHGRIEVVPNGVDLARYAPAPNATEDARRLVFVGQMGWFPNRDGIEFFIDRILPGIRARHPAQLHVIGHSHGMQAPPQWRDAVRFTGFVDDLRHEVRLAAVYVVPLRAGSGTRLKLLEAMAMGKAIVSTRIGAEGLGLVHDVSALLADTPDEFVAAVCALLEDPARRARLGSAARALAEQRFGWDAVGARLRATYDDAMTDAARLARQR